MALAPRLLPRGADEIGRAGIAPAGQQPAHPRVDPRGERGGDTGPPSELGQPPEARVELAGADLQDLLLQVDEDGALAETVIGAEPLTCGDRRPQRRHVVEDAEHLDEVGVDPGRLFCVAVRQRDLQRLPDVRLALDYLAGHLRARHTEVRPGQCPHVLPPGPFGQRHRVAQHREGVGDAAGEDQQGAAVQQHLGPLAVERVLAEQCSRPVVELLGLVDLAGHQQVAGQPHPQGGLAVREIQVDRQRDGAPPVRHGLGEPLRDVELPREVVEQVRARCRRQRADVARGRLEEGECLPVRAARGSITGGGGSELQHGGRIPGADRVVHEPFAITGAQLAQGADDVGVQATAAQHRQRGVDGAAGQLVAGRDVAVADLDDAMLLGRRELSDIRPEQGRGQSRVDGVGQHRQALDRGDRRRRQVGDARRDGFGDALRQLRRRRREHLGDEERVAARDPVQRGAVPRPGQPGHGRHGQRLQLDVDGRPAGQPAQEGLRRMLRGQCLRPHRHEQERRKLGDPPGDVAQHVQGRVVRPVHVVDDQYRGSRPQLRHRGSGDVGGGVGQRCRQRPRTTAGRLQERRQRSHRQQVVASSGEHPHRGRQLGQERPDQARLADPGFPAEHDDRAASDHGLLRRRAQDGQVGSTLPQRLPGLVRHAAQHCVPTRGGTSVNAARDGGGAEPPSTGCASAAGRPTIRAPPPTRRRRAPSRAPAPGRSRGTGSPSSRPCRSRCGRTSRRPGPNRYA